MFVFAVILVISNRKCRFIVKQQIVSRQPCWCPCAYVGNLVLINLRLRKRIIPTVTKYDVVCDINSILREISN